MKIDIIKIEKGRLRLKIEGETFTFGNLLQKALIDDKRILGAGFHQPHPFKKEIVFDIFFKEDVPVENYKDIIIECIEKMIKYLNDLRDLVMTSLEVGK